MVSSIQVVITMAGLGRRFREAGYQRPKYEIIAHGKPLFDWALESLRNFIDAGCCFWFIARKEDAPQSFIEASVARLGIHAYQLVLVDALTDGQATTVLKARSSGLKAEAPLVIYNIDTYVDPRYLPLDVIRAEGWVPCFPAQGEGWSFARVDAQDRILELREKKRISDHATIGLYYFSSFKLYEQAYHKYYEADQRLDAGERYIAPLYNQLISEGLEVYMHRVPAQGVIPLGTPAEVDTFNAKFDVLGPPQA